MSVDLQDLRAFVTVSETRHFGKAAILLRVAQPALSQRIQRLERELGTILLARTSRSVVPTPAGDVLYERARVILRQVDRDLEQVRRIGRGEEGLLNVGIVSSAIPLGPIENVQEFRALYPLVEVRLHEGFTADMMRRVAEGDLDVATVRDPDDMPGTKTTVLLTEPFVAVLPVGHPLAESDTVDGAALAPEPLVFFPRRAGQRAYDLNLQPMTAAGVRPRIVQEASTWTTVIRLVGAGLGVTVAPLSATIAAPSTVVVLPLTGSDARSTVRLATRADESRALVRNYVDLSSLAPPLPPRTICSPSSPGRPSSLNRAL